MSKFFVFIGVTLCTQIALSKDGPLQDVTTAPLPPLNLVEIPEYSEKPGDDPASVQVEKLQYEALEDGRPLLEKQPIKEETKSGALYEAGEDLVISPESSINPSDEPIEDTEDLQPPPPPEALLESPTSSGEIK